MSCTRCACVPVACVLQPVCCSVVAAAAIRAPARPCIQPLRLAPSIPLLLHLASILSSTLLLLPLTFSFTTGTVTGLRVAVLLFPRAAQHLETSVLQQVLQRVFSGQLNRRSHADVAASRVRSK